MLSARIIIPLSLFGAVMLAGCSSIDLSTSSSNSTSQQDPVSIAEQELTSSMNIEVAWQSEIDLLQGGHKLSFVENRLCLFSDNGHLYTLDPATGVASVQFKLDAAISAGGPCTASRAVAVTDGAQLVVIDRARGDRVWRRPLFSKTLGSPVLLGGTVITMLTNGRILAHALSNGELLWEVLSGAAKVRFKGLFRPAAIPDFNILVFGSPDGSLNSLNTLDGFIEWSVQLAAERQLDPISNLAHISGPALNRTGVCASSYNGKLGCYNSLSGQTLWQTDLSAASTTASDDEFLYLVDSNGVLRSYSISSGDLLWSVPDASTQAAPLVYHWNGMLLVDGGSDIVRIYEAVNGALVSVKEIPGLLIDAIEIDEDLIVSTTDGVVFRLRRG